MISLANHVIETANDDSGAEIGTLIASVYSEYEGCPFVPDEIPELEAISTHYRRIGGEIWVARFAEGENQGSNIVGSLAMFPTTKSGVFELSKVYVSRDSRGTGLAQQLYSQAVKWGAANCLQSLRLWTDTRFLSGHRFYEKLGFARQPVVRYLGDAGQTWEYLYTCEHPTAPS